MNPFEMVVLIVAIVMVTGIIRAKYGYERRPGLRGRHNMVPPADTAENERLREEVKTLKERVAVLERIATDSGNRLEDEIDRLRDRTGDRV
jgi:hypothetical protein